MKKWLNWFDASDSLDTTATFLVCLPFLFLITPPMLAAQLPGGFLPLTLLGWALLPTLTWQTGQWAQRRSGRVGRRGFASLLIWVGVSYTFTPLMIFVGAIFWQQHDYPWTAGFLVLTLFVLWESASRLRDYARPLRRGSQDLGRELQTP